MSPYTTDIRSIASSSSSEGMNDVPLTSLSLSLINPLNYYYVDPFSTPHREGGGVNETGTLERNVSALNIAKDSTKVKHHICFEV
jgi:hypothetical protein